MDVDHILDRFNPRFYRGLDIGEGWKPLVIQLDKRLAEIDPDYTIAQIKEKFGGLRFYTDKVNAGERTEEFKNLIREAEKVSYTICETCGEPGEITQGPWVQTLCKEHTT